MILETDFRAILADEINSRKIKNSRYSLRAFARDLSLSPAFVSNVLNGRKALSESRARRIGQKMRWPKSKVALFITLVRFDLAKDPEAKAQILAELDPVKVAQYSFKDLEMSEFSLVADWYYFAVAELVHLPNFRANRRWVSERLLISESQAQDALDRLEKIGVIRLVNGKYQKSFANYKSPRDIPSTEIRRFHRQILTKAEKALDEQSVETRDFSSVTVAMSLKQMRAAKDKIDRFRREMMEFLEERDDREAVYNLSIQLFRLDQESV